MAVPAVKRRKLSHSPSDDGEDDRASFASFDDVEEGNNGVGDDLEAMQEDALEEMDEDDADEDEEKAQAITKTTTQKTAAARQQSRARGATAVQASSAAYTGGTFKSNMFKLQVDEMLGQIRPGHGKRETRAEEALHKLKKTIEQIPSREPLPVLEAERELIKKSRVAVPFPEPRPAHDVKYKLAYAKPANINVIGSYPLKLSTKTDQTLSIDMLVTIPHSLLQDKDYLNHRYFYKRAFYLACIAAGLRAAVADEFTIKFAHLHDNPLHPILCVQAKKGKTDWQINVIPGVSDGTFSHDKLIPSKNCVRPVKDGDSEDQGQTLPSTPFYNASVQADTQITSYLKLLHAASSSCEAFKDACLLGRVWLRQHGFTSGASSGGFGNFEWAALIAILLKTGGGSGKPLLSSGYSSYQLFKATLQYLAAKDLVKQPAVLQADHVKLMSEDGQPILFDGPRGQNVLYKMTAWSYQHLRVEAKTTLQMLGDNLFDQFEATFILRVDSPLRRFDSTVKIPCSTFPSAKEDRDVLQRYQKVFTALSEGLGDRATQVVLHSPAHEHWEVGSARPSSDRKGHVLIHISLNPANATRTVDHGPAAESKKEAAAFRKFWGEKAELRRFKDGSILESLVWTAKEGAPSIVQQIIDYLLERHLGNAVSSSLVYSGDAFAGLVKHNSGLNAFQPIMEALKTLETDIRAMEDLPLTVRQIMPADAQLRYASVDVPLSHSQKYMTQPADIVIQFEGSGRWPDDLVAIQRTKIAFLLKISELYSASGSSVTSRVGLENEGIDILNQAFLDIVYESGAAFRLRIHHDREQTLLDRQLKDKTAAPSTKESAATALAAYKRDFLKRPAHTQAVQKLCTRFPALSPTLRLTKSWFAAHLLSNHFPEELIELLTIQTFTCPWPFQPPTSVQAAFTRTLGSLASWDWRTNPLIVDLGAELKTEDVQTISTRFDAWRKLDPAMNRVVLFAASSLDPDGTTWTDGAPAKVVAGRMTALAQAASAEIETKGLDLVPESLFVSPLADYDFVLYLSPEFAGGAKKNKKHSSAQFKNLVLAEEANAEMVGYAPAHALYEELVSVYGQAMMLFYGNGATIAGLWSPVTARRGWKVNLAYSTVPVKGEGDEIEAEINKEGILAEMARLGGDLVAKIEVMR